MKNSILSAAISVLLSTFISGCTEPYALQTNTFEDAIVIEATLTNELKNQEIKLSRTYTLEDNGPNIEHNATVYVQDNLGNRYDFTESNNKYVSTTAFKAEPNRNYQLHITTSKGKSYVSSNEQLTTATQIESLTAGVVTKDNGDRGVQITVNSNDPTNTSKYYRYEYDETYKVIAPKWSADQLVVTGATSSVLVPRTSEARICYGHYQSTDILLANTSTQSNDILSHPLRFLSTKNYIISHRYSILVRMYVENLNAYNYYNTLNKISNSGSILSQTQPGLIAGNIKSQTNPNEKVIGFFDVCSVSEKRLFFNYADLFPGEPLPPYYTNCDDHIFKYCFSPADLDCQGWSVLGAIELGTDTYYYNDGGFYHLVNTPCGDCSSFSSNVIPSFWID